MCIITYTVVVKGPYSCHRRTCDPVGWPADRWRAYAQCTKALSLSFSPSPSPTLGPPPPPPPPPPPLSLSPPPYGPNPAGPSVIVPFPLDSYWRLAHLRTGGAVRTLSLSLFGSCVASVLGIPPNVRVGQ